MSKRDLQASVALALAIGVAAAAATPALAQGLPQHMVAYMTGAGQTQCPENWTEAAYAQGRVILGTIDGSKIQKVAGTPAMPGEVPKHVHTFKVTGTVASTPSPHEPGGNIARAAGGEATSTGTTDPTPTALPFIKFLVCEHMVAESPDSAPYETVAFFNAQSCPKNWKTLRQADGRFLVPAFSGGTLGYATSTTWDPTNPKAGHTHELAASFGTVLNDNEAFPDYSGDLAKQGNYGLSGISGRAGPVLPFVSLLVCEKEEGIGNNEGVPLGTMIFFGGENCPDDWGVTIGGDGRFIIGIGGNGKQGATFGSPIKAGETSIQHTHSFSGEVRLPASAYPGGPPRTGFEEQRFVGTGAHYSSDASGPATDELPYLVLQACTYTAGQEDWQGAGRPGRQ